LSVVVNWSSASHSLNKQALWLQLTGDGGENCGVGSKVCSVKGVKYV
jgi:hypothetical protein